MVRSVFHFILNKNRKHWFQPAELILQLSNKMLQKYCHIVQYTELNSVSIEL